MKKHKSLQCNERFTKFRKRNLIKMWRTLKAESGYRQTISGFPNHQQTLRELMDIHEERMIDEKDKSWTKKHKKR